MSTTVPGAITVPDAASDVGRRHTATAQSLHWITAILMFAILPLAWVMVNMPRTAPSREWVYMRHKSLGLTVLALVAFRLAWRASHPAPALPAHLAHWEALAARLSRWLLYLVMIGMPVSGYLFSAFRGHGTAYFSLFAIPGPPANAHWAAVADWFHVATGQ